MCAEHGLHSAYQQGVGSGVRCARVEREQWPGGSRGSDDGKRREAAWCRHGGDSQGMVLMAREGDYVAMGICGDGRRGCSYKMEMKKKIRVLIRFRDKMRLYRKWC